MQPDTPKESYTQFENGRMTEGKFRQRHRLRRKEIKAIQAEMNDSFGFSPIGGASEVEVAQTSKWTVILEHDQIIGVYFNDRLFPTVRALLRKVPDTNHVTVDMGAVKFVVNGADIMSPGIVDADPRIRPGDIVWIRDEKNGKPIAVGTAILSGEEMRSSESGKAVKNMHYVGDEIWDIG